MARISEQQAGGRNVLAFMDMIRFSEIGPDLIRISDQGYNVIVGSTPSKPILMRDYADHPNVYVKSVNSTAAGAYQILFRFWGHYKALLKLPDFSPESQDRYVLQILKEQRALDHIKAGRLETAVGLCSNIWTSLPGAGYGQHEHKLENLVAAYKAAGGTLA